MYLFRSSMNKKDEIPSKAVNEDKQPESSNNSDKKDAKEKRAVEDGCKHEAELKPALLAYGEDPQRESSDAYDFEFEDRLESLMIDIPYNDNPQEPSTAIEELNENNKMLQDRIDSLEEMVDNIALRLGMKESDMSALEKKNADLKHSLREVDIFLRTTQPQTLRFLLILRLLETSISQKTSDNNTDGNQEPEVWWPNGLSYRQLDEICDPADFGDMVNLLPRGSPHDYFYRRLEAVNCAVCSKQKFKFRPEMRPRENSLAWIHEFPSRSNYFSCCYEELCRSCLLEHVVNSLKYQWWRNPQSLQWIHCPCCSSVLSIRCEADLRVCLEQNGSTEVEKLIRM